MFGWFGELNAKERRTMGACFGGWALDAFDVQMYSFVIPTVIATVGSVARRGRAHWHSHIADLVTGRVVLGHPRRPVRPGADAADHNPVVFVLHVSLRLRAELRAALRVAGTARARFRRRMGGRRGADGRGDPRQIPRPRRSASVQTGWAIGWGASALVYTALYAFLPESIAWRVLFAIGLLPAGLVFWIRRHIEEPEIFRDTRNRTSVGIGHLFAAFRGPHLWTTVKVTVMVAGAQGGGYALGLWMPTYLRTVRGLSATSTGGFLLVQILGALFGFLLGAYLSDVIGRKWTFMWSAIGSFVMILIYMFVPMDNTMLLFVGVPLFTIFLIKFWPMGPFMTELYPTRSRDSPRLLLQCRPGVRLVPAGYSGVCQPEPTARRHDRPLQRLRLCHHGRDACALTRNPRPQPDELG